MVKAICVNGCYTAHRWYDPGMYRNFPDKKSVHPDFKFLEVIVEEKKPPKSFPQLTVEEYKALAKKEGIDIPNTIQGKDKLRDFLKVRLEEKAEAAKEEAGEDKTGQMELK